MIEGGRPPSRGCGGLALLAFGKVGPKLVGIALRDRMLTIDAGTVDIEARKLKLFLE